MTKQATQRPTDAELAILRVLWERGPSTVRQVHNILNEIRPTVYTTILKLMQIMDDKGLVRRDKSQRAHVYQPAFTEAETQKRLAGDLLERAFSGSTASLLMQALSAKEASPEELAQIQQILDEVKEGGLQ
jgi:predicted transcriptional regulator